MTRILLVDNFDSFSYNLVDEFEKRRCNVDVYRNNIPMSEMEKIIGRDRPNLIVISPGPASPKDAGISIPIVKRYAGEIPMFGVCLGYQSIIEAFGGKIEKAPETLHGKASSVSHDGQTIFRGLDNPLHVGRYHSLYASEIPDCFERSAEVGGINMAVRHREFNLEGVLFHPESILTTLGGKIIENVLLTVFKR